MSWVSAIPIIGNLAGKLIERIWPDKNVQREKALEIELEEARQSGGRITPRQALKYVYVLGFVVCLVLLVVQFFRPELSVPDGLDEMLSLGVSLFGL